MRLVDHVKIYEKANDSTLLLDNGDLVDIAYSSVLFCSGREPIQYAFFLAEFSGDNKSDTSYKEVVCITDGEWSLISPLFELKAELENSRMLESSGTQGINLYGRATSEIQSDINLFKETYQQKAFTHEIITV